MIGAERPDATLDATRVLARDVMSEPAIACSEDAPIEYVVDLLADREISGLPVVDKRGRVVGVLSERDVAETLGGSLMRLALHRSAVTGPFLRAPHNGVKRVAREIMTTPPIVAAPDANVGDLSATMMDHAVNRIPIVADGRLVGIVTRADILRLLSTDSRRHDLQSRSALSH